MEDNMVRNLKLYGAFLIASLKKMMLYRIDCLVGMFSQVAFQVIELVFIWIVFQNTETIAGWNFEQLLLLYGVMMLSVSVTELLFDATYDIGRKLIRKGKFDTTLLRPVHPLVSILGDSESYTALGYIVILLILIVAMLIRLHIAVTFLLVMKIVYFGILGGFIIGGIQTIFSVAGLWSYKSNEIVWSVFQLHKLAQYPIGIYNRFIKLLISGILPFAFASYYPTLDYLGQQQNYLILLTPCIALLIWMIAIKIWNWALKKYRSTGN